MDRRMEIKTTGPSGEQGMATTSRAVTNCATVMLHANCGERHNGRPKEPGVLCPTPSRKEALTFHNANWGIKGLL